MSNQTYPTVNQILSLMQAAKFGWHSALKKKYPDFVLHLKTLKGNSLKEQVYNYCYPGNYVCKHCGSANVSFKEFTTGYRAYCSRKCTSASVACKEGQQQFLSDPLKVSARTAAMRKTCINRFGGPSPMSDPAIKQIVSNKSIATNRKKFPNQINGRSRKQYTSAVRHRTNNIYKKHIVLIDPTHIRSFDFVIDHIYSIFDGFVNNVPIDIITHPSNLQMISRTDNSSKNARSDKTLTQLYEDACYLSL